LKATSVAKRVGAKAATRSNKKPSGAVTAKARLPKGPAWQWSALDMAAAVRSGAVSAV
jgi:amidase